MWVEFARIIVTLIASCSVLCLTIVNYLDLFLRIQKHTPSGSHSSSVHPSPPLPSLLLLHRLQQSPQAANRQERVGVIRAQSPLTSLETAAKERFGEAELALSVQQTPNRKDRPERVGVIAPHGALTSLESAAHEGLG